MPTLKEIMEDMSPQAAARRPTAAEFEKIAITVMTTLEENNLDTFVLIKDDLIRNWWARRKEDIRKAEEARIEKERMAKIKEDVLSRLSEEEKIALGLIKVAKVMKHSLVNTNEFCDEYDQLFSDHYKKTVLADDFINDKCCSKSQVDIDQERAEFQWRKDQLSKLEIPKKKGI